MGGWPASQRCHTGPWLTKQATRTEQLPLVIGRKDCIASLPSGGPATN